MKLDYLNGTNYTLYQPEDMYHFNADTELLGRFMDVHRKDSVLVTTVRFFTMQNKRML